MAQAFLTQSTTLSGLLNFLHDNQAFWPGPGATLEALKCAMGNTVYEEGEEIDGLNGHYLIAFLGDLSGNSVFQKAAEDTWLVSESLYDLSNEHGIDLTGLPEHATTDNLHELLAQAKFEKSFGDLPEDEKKVVERLMSEVAGTLSGLVEQLLEPVR